MSVKLDNYDLSAYTIILTGGTDGIGKEMARILSSYNPKRLILTARNKEKGSNVLEYIKSSNGNADNVEVWEMDLADLQSVKNFANKFINEVGELNMLIHNAGIWTSRQIIKTKDNLELQFQVNCISPFLLTRLLVDTIKKSSSTQLPGKISFTSSSTQSRGEIDFDNLNLEKGYYLLSVKAYANTKLMNLIISKEFGRILQNDNIITYSPHPGIIQTNLSNMNNAFMSFLFNVLTKTLGTTPEKGAINALYPVLSPENKETGKYYNQGIEEKPNSLADDQELVTKFWNVSEQILKDCGMI